MEIEIISKESIKPSSPTPHHLKTFKLCVLDQLVVTPYIPITLYYPNHNGNNILQALEWSEALKKSLSKTLTQFYPLAGTIKDGLSIDCNDVGAFYVVASIRRRLDEYLSHPDLQLINKFLPVELNFNGSSAGSCITNVQVTIFECGGIAIGLCVSHRILDGTALSVFLKGWANMACGSKEVVHPDLTAPSLFPAKDLWLQDSSMILSRSLFEEGKFSTKRFVFDSNGIAALKAEAARNGVQHPTRVEVVTALIWKCAKAASEEVCGSQRSSGLSHMVNLRRKLPGSSSKNSICNLIWVAYARCNANYETTLHGLVGKVRESILKIDDEFVTKAQGDKGRVVLEKSLKEIEDSSKLGIRDNFSFTSWCRMGFYEIDFGWGTPVWVTGIVGDGSPVFANMVTLMDTKSGEGIEAWVNLVEPKMEILQTNPKLLAYASVDPSLLLNGEVASIKHSTGHEDSTV